MTRERYDEICAEVDADMKSRNGHSFETILKTRCVYCGRSPKAKGQCRGWFMTFVNLLFYRLENEPAGASHAV